MARQEKSTRLTEISDCNHIADLRDLLLTADRNHNEIRWKRPLICLVSSLFFALCFELGRRSDTFILFQFLIASFSFYFLDKCNRRLWKTKLAIDDNKIAAIFNSVDRGTQLSLHSQLSLLATTNQSSPLQAGGLMIVGFALLPNLQQETTLPFLWIPSLALGGIYFVATYISSLRIKQIEYARAAHILERLLTS